MSVKEILENYTLTAIPFSNINGVIELIRKNEWNYVVSGTTRVIYQMLSPPVPLFSIKLINKKNDADWWSIAVTDELLKIFYREMRKVKIMSLE